MEKFLAELFKYSNWAEFRNGKQVMFVLQDGDEFILLTGEAGIFRGYHILKQQLLKVALPRFGMCVTAVQSSESDF